MDKQKRKLLLWILIPVVAVLLAGGITLLAVFGGERTVSFYNEDGTLLLSESYKRGDTFEIPENPVKDDCMFVGWVLNNKKEPYDFFAKNALVVHKNMKFTAKFAVDGYVVNFVDSNGITVLDTRSYSYGDEIVLPQEPEKDGHVFEGWMRSGDASVYDFDVENAKKVKGSVTFTAKFSANKCKVQFLDKDGNLYKGFTLRYGDSFLPPEPIEVEGYAFTGWTLKGENEPFVFTAAEGAKVSGVDWTFLPIYEKLTKVTGRIYKFSSGTFPKEVKLLFGEMETTVPLGNDGTFSAYALPGEHVLTAELDGYRAVEKKVTIGQEETKIGDVKVLQKLTKDFTWWGGATKKESGSSVILSTAYNAHAQSATEYKIGKNITSASSWKASAYVYTGTDGRVGFSVGGNDSNNGTIFFYIDPKEGTCGFFTWATYKEQGLGVNNYSEKLSDEVLQQLKAYSVCTLTLTAADIKGAGTGWLTLYVNDTPVMELYNNFVGVSSGGKGVDGQVLNLSKVHLSLAVMGKAASTSFSDYYYKLNCVKATKTATVTGKLTKVDKTALVEKVTLRFGTACRIVDVKDGSFSAKLPLGEDKITVSMDGYWGIVDTVSLTGAKTDVGTVKLLQKVSKDMAWWSGVTMTKLPGAVQMTTGADVNAESGAEYKVGGGITAATSWKLESQILSGDAGMVGFSVARDDANNGTLVLYVDRQTGTYGFFTWATNQYTGPKEMFTELHSKKYKGSGQLDAALLEAMASGYTLKLAATNIQGEGTGYMTLYVNDTAVMTLEAANFQGVLNGGKGVDGQKLDLSQGHISLVLIGKNANATFKDFYYVQDQEKDLKFGTVKGTVAKVDGTDGFPTKLVLRSDAVYRQVDVAADGTFSAVLPTGSYTADGTANGYRLASDSFTVVADTTTNVQVKLLQNLVQDFKWWNGSTMTEAGTGVVFTTKSSANKESATEYKLGESITTDAPATSWIIASHIEPGSTGNVGFSVGTQGGNNGTIFFYVNKDSGETGFFSWGTFQYYGTLRTGGGLIDGNTLGYYPVSDSVKSMLNSKDGYDLKLVATNIDGRRSGFLTLYVNDTAVLEMYNNFVGKASGGKGTDGQRPHLSQVHLSLVAQGTGISATFTDYYYKVNSNAGKAVGKVTCNISGASGTALVKFGSEYRLVNITDGAFTTQLPVGTYSMSGVVGGSNVTADNIVITEGAVTEVTVKLMQDLTADCVWNGGATLTQTDNGVVMETANKTNAATEYKIDDNITSATSWIAETYVVPNSTDKGIVGFTVGGNDANNGMIMFVINYENQRLHINSWGTYKLASTYSARAGENALNESYATTATGTMTTETQKTFKFGTWSNDVVYSSKGYKLTLKAENIGTAQESLTFYLNDVEMLKLTDMNILGAVEGGKGVAGQKLDLSDVHVSLVTIGKSVKATFKDYFLKVNK